MAQQDEKKNRDSKKFVRQNLVYFDPLRLCSGLSPAAHNGCARRLFSINKYRISARAGLSVHACSVSISTILCSIMSSSFLSSASPGNDILVRPQ